MGKCTPDEGLDRETWATAESGVSIAEMYRRLAILKRGPKAFEL